jgi:hypothetical protein
MRSFSAFLSAVRNHVGRMMTWLPWLGIALLVVAALSPGSVTASRLVFQSPPESPPAVTPTPIPLTPTPPPPPPPPPTPTPPPPEPATEAPTPVPPALTPTESAPVETGPAEVVPTEVAPAEATSPAEGGPTQEAPPPIVEPTQPPPPVPQATVPAQVTQVPEASPVPPAERSPDAKGGQPVINWVKFWDTMAVLVAYPWLCCGVGLLLLVPLILLFLEIKGRRPPPIPPEPLPTEKKGTRNEG